MTSDEAERRLVELLREAGVDLPHPGAADVATTWAVMRRFADERVEDCQPQEEEGDGFLAQYGSYDGAFQLDITRQFIFADQDGEYDHMAQLNCTFHFDVSEALLASGNGNMWSFDMAMDDLFESALAMPGFRAVAETAAPPRELSIIYGEV